MNFNRLILGGRLTRDVELRQSASGKQFAKSGIAVSDYRDKDQTMFVEVTFFGRAAEIAAEHLQKGSEVLLEGRLTLHRWTAQDGTNQSRHSMIVEQLMLVGSKAQRQQAAF